MAVKIADTLKALSNTFPVAECVDIDVNINGATKRLQKAIDDGEIGGGSDSTWKGTREEWEVLSTEEKGKYEVICFTDDYDESGIGESDSTWKGTKEEWESLSTEEKGNYEIVYFTNDYDDSGICESDSIWKGTLEEWEALSTEEKEKYDVVYLTNDYDEIGLNNTKLTELNDVDNTDIGNGKTLIYDAADKKHKYVKTTLTDELVKMDNTSDPKHLAELIDKNTIVNDNGVLKVKKLDGQEVTITEINFLKGLTMNVMDLVKSFANGGVKMYEHTIPTYADLLALDRSSFIDGVRYFVYVLADENNGGIKTTYICDKTNTSYFGVAGDDRDFVTEPINLTNEVTGKLPPNNIDVEALWKLVTVYDTYKELTVKNEPFGTHGAKSLYDELVTSIGNKVNKTDILTNDSDSATHEQVYSAKTINTELYNYVKKTDLSTLYATNNLNNFKGTIFKVGRGSGYNNETSNVPNGIDRAFVVGYIPYNNGNNYGVQRLTTVEGKCATFERDLNNGVWGKWRKLCSTSVADIPKTIIQTFDDETKYASAQNQTNMYEVVDGECELALYARAISPSNSTQAVILSSVPKPRIPIYFTLNGWGNTSDCVTAIVKVNGTVNLIKGTAGGTYLGSMKYRVAEE